MLAQKEFPFEDYLLHSLPDYEHEWNVIIRKIILASIFFIIIAPLALKSIFRVKPAKDEEPSYSPTTTNHNKDAIESNKENQRKGKRSKIKGKSIQKEMLSKHDNNSDSTTPEVTSEVPLALLIILNVTYILIVFGFIAASPNNIDTSRRVYQAPMLDKSECQMIIDMATRAAKRNVENAKEELASIPKSLGLNFNEEEDPFGEIDSKDDPYEDQKKKLQKLLEWPEGWKKDRHEFYPTTDLNVVLDFEKEDKEKISKILHARLSPLLARIYGISKDSIRANDLFVVRYDGNGQQSLNAHTDSSHISFNILLNDNFDGGGTRFYDRLYEEQYDARPKPGDVLINNAMVRHEGLATTKGTRYIFVGFMNIDQIDPWTGRRNNVPIYSTYLSFPWLTVSLKEFFDDKIHAGVSAVRGSALSHLSQSQQMEFVSTAIACTMFLGDYFAPHGLVKLIDQKKRKDYLNDLDEFYEHNKDQIDKSMWFKGQNINLNLDGTVAGEWIGRKENGDKFVEL